MGKWSDGKKSKSMSQSDIKYNYFQCDRKEVVDALGKEGLKAALFEMILVDQFEVWGQEAYRQGQAGGFYHGSQFQQAITTAAIAAMGKENYWMPTYRCHSLAISLGATLRELMAELYGKVTGCAKGMGGSMHLIAPGMPTGIGIVGGQFPLAAGFAFSLKYRKQKDQIAVGFTGDGAVAQGTFHETLNLASLWELPLLLVIENNQWGMGTAVPRAICSQPIAESFAKGYGIDSYSVDGTDFFALYALFKKVKGDILATSRPVLIEAVCERLAGHSISDPGHYRTKEELEEIKRKSDPIKRLSSELKELNLFTDEEFEEMKAECKKIAKDAVAFAEKSPEPSPEDFLEKGVLVDE